MAKRYDAMTRSYLEKYPADWVAALGLRHAARVRVVNSDVSTITAEADKVLLIEGDLPWLVHIELQTRHDPKLPLRILRYNVLLSHRSGLPVHTVVVLLTPAADGPDLNGVFEQRSPDGRCWLEFHYHVVRVWELDLEGLLTGGIGTLPLAPLAARSEADMPAIVEGLKRRMDPAATSAEAQEFWSATTTLAGLRFPWESIKHWFEGVTAMKESSGYQGLLQEGRVEGRSEEARKIILRLGELRFGPPDAFEPDLLFETIADLDHLERLTERLLIASSWTELLAEPS